ncbi:TPA: hypothetical protein N0F65_002995 [Lagenidium giganteum]|uniref:Uncharacterized protein n=1 Tax=Lagenidium giganteum TaxID=4803 RepID=A0AAV2YNN1_9STRA|nr:TPA: hypothetical protein N0F65_002995 [Lagenidium giganteum]
MIYRSPISWVARKHHTVVLSTTEAEYIALCHGMRKSCSLSCSISKSLFPQRSTKIAHNPELHGRSKHIAIR